MARAGLHEIDTPKERERERNKWVESKNIPMTSGSVYQVRP
jgi:hypothetical protein